MGAKTAEDLRRAVRGIDRRGYPACKSLAGGYRFDGFDLFIDHVQGDPFASPSSLRVEVPHDRAGFPESCRDGAVARRALADWLTRRFSTSLARRSMRVKGSGKSGLLATSRCGQEVLERSACEVTDAGIVVRFRAGFPAFGRTVSGEGLERMLLDFVPQCVRESLLFRNVDADAALAAVRLAEDQAALRAFVRDEGLVAFVADGSLLPRASGASDAPLPGGVPFASPASLRRTVCLPHAGEVSGMAVPRGVTLVVGGGYHGKSTLLAALQNGVYDHVAGDGRELVATDASALKLRAEDGRPVRDVDVSPFIGDLPNGKDTSRFSTSNASGSTSQAACLIEGLEAGTRTLLIDEDTSATNFMVRDELMNRVIARDKEPITPFLERARSLYEDCGVSTVLVAGSSGAFFRIADTVVQMDCYQPVDITERVRAVCAEAGSGVAALDGARAGASCGEGEAPRAVWPCGGRVLPPVDCGGGRGLRGGRGGRGGRGDGRGDRGDRGGRGGRGDGRGRGPERAKAKALGRDELSVGKVQVNVRLVEQLADDEQTLALAYLMRYALEQLVDGERTLADVVRETFRVLDDRGWEPFCGSHVPCGLARPREQELFACLNRMRW